MCLRALPQAHTSLAPCKKVHRTSNKKHFRKNVKECRDVMVEKEYKQGRDGSVTHHVFDLIAPYIVVTHLEG